MVVVWGVNGSANEEETIIIRGDEHLVFG